MYNSEKFRALHRTVGRLNYDSDGASAIVLARSGIRRPLIDLKYAKRISGLEKARRKKYD